MHLIINRFHNGNLYFNTPIKINDNLIIQTTGLSNKGEPIPIRLNPDLVEELTSTLIGNNSRGVVVNQIIYDTQKITIKVIINAPHKYGKRL